MAESGTRKPTHLCLDCGAVGYAGGYHDHGNGDAGDTCSIAEALRIVREVGDAKDDRDRALRERDEALRALIDAREAPTRRGCDRIIDRVLRAAGSEKENR